MSAGKAACGTVAGKVGDEVAKQPGLASYPLLQPFSGLGDRAVPATALPDPQIMTRVVTILRQLQSAIPLFRAMPDSDARCPQLAERIELLKVDLENTLRQDRTGMIRASLARIQNGQSLAKGGDDGA